MPLSPYNGLLMGMRPEFIQDLVNATSEQLKKAIESANTELSNYIPERVCLPCLTCEQLAEQLTENKEKQTDVALIEAGYDPAKPLPENYRRATQQDLKNLGLSDGESNLLKLDGEPDFGAHAFMHTDPITNVVSPKIIFDGTDFKKTSDIIAGGAQAFGFKSSYFEQAKLIGHRLLATGNKASFAGHSLGGALAATASGASGMPARTFNAAGLHRNTRRGLKYSNSSNVTATHVQGEILNLSQDIASPFPSLSGNVPRAFGDRDVIPAGNPNAYQPIERHRIEKVGNALEEQESDIKKQMKDKKCP